MKLWRLLLITAVIWLGSVLFFIFVIGFTAAITDDLPAARMDIPVLALGAVGVFTAVASFLLLRHSTQPVENNVFRWLWIGAFSGGEVGTLFLLMLIALLALNR